MSEPETPVVLEVEGLPREQVGPFVLLGVGKEITAEAAVAAHTERIRLAREGKLALAPGDIDWALEQLTDPDRRAAADAGSLNLDTSAGDLARLRARYPAGRPAWEPVPAPLLAVDGPDADLPDSAGVRAALPVPVPPAELPAADRLLRELVEGPIDPWGESVPE